MWGIKCFRKTLASLCCLKKTHYEKEQEQVLRCIADTVPFTRGVEQCNSAERKLNVLSVSRRPITGTLSVTLRFTI